LVGAVAVDHFSRNVLGFAVFLKQPTSAEIQRFLDRAIGNVGRAPKHLISDKGTQFWRDSFKNWCARRRIRPRFGAVKKYGSISVVERFIRSMKSECTRRLLVPITLDAVRRELALYVVWFNEFRPIQALGGRTPREVYEGLRPANAMPRLEPRARWRERSGCASPVVFHNSGRIKLPGAFVQRVHTRSTSGEPHNGISLRWAKHRLAHGWRRG
jgi:hypothetical protein